ncbi:hypothetical protein ACX80W_10120 [Arthrobacter sp. TMN-37]
MAESADSRGQSPADGVRFSERLSGWLELPHRQAAVRLELRATMDGWEAFRTDPHHRLNVEGTVDIDGFASGRPVTGTVALFPDDAGAAVGYSLTFSTDDGVELHLNGAKAQRPGNPRALWYDFTTTRFELTSADGDVLRGLLRTPTPQALRSLASLRATAGSVPLRLGTLARFALHFSAGAVRGLLADRPAARR